MIKGTWKIPFLTNSLVLKYRKSFKYALGMQYLAKFVLISFAETASSSKKLYEILCASFVNRFCETIGFLLCSCSEASVES